MRLDVQMIKQELIDSRILADGPATVTPLDGGVSSDICMIAQGESRVVVKQALARLKVDAPWQVDVSRNVTEQHFIRRVSAFLPAAVPQLLHCSERRNYFVMAYLDGYAPWKAQLMAGTANPLLARRAGALIATVHAKTWGDAESARRFDTTDGFHALRTDPYLLTAAGRHPALAPRIHAEAIRLEQTRLCLVHGDFSPKNIMIDRDQMKLIDCEVAWYGEPAFDLAFLCNHFLLKALHHRNAHERFLDLVAAAWSGYESGFGALAGDFEQRTARLLLMLMLARVDGKSPVEYLVDESDKDTVRSFVHELLPRGVFGLDEIRRSWGRHLSMRHA